MTIAPIAEHKSIITSGAVCLYIAYFTWSALTSSVIGQTDESAGNCNPFADQTKTYTIQVLIGLGLYIVALIYVSYASSESTLVHISN